MIQHFFRLGSSLLDVLPGLNERLRFEHDRLNNSFEITELIAVVIQDLAGLLRYLVTPLEAPTQLLCAAAQCLSAHPA